MVSWIFYLNKFATPSALKCKSLCFPLMSEIKLPKCWHFISVHFTALSDALSEPPKSTTEAVAGGGVDAVNRNKFTFAWGRNAHPLYIYFCHLQRENSLLGKSRVCCGAKWSLQGLSLSIKNHARSNAVREHKNRMVQGKLAENTALLLLFILSQWGKCKNGKNCWERNGRFV